jgi:hypothetical protein
MPAGDWERVNGRSWSYAGRAPVWPDDYPPTCDCNPPLHTVAQINADKSFHSRTCPEFRVPMPQDARHRFEREIARARTM